MNGKMPPQNVETEKVVLGALILEPKAYLKVSEILTVDCFYKNEHQIIFGSIIDLFLMNEPIDMINLVKKISKAGKLEEIGGAYYITTLTSNVASAAHLESHASELVDLSIRRKLIQYSAELNSNAYDNTHDTDQLLVFASNLVDRTLSMINKRSEIKPFNDSLKAAIDFISQKQAKTPENNIKPILRALRDKIPDWNTGEVVIVAGRPGMAKTSYALFELYEQAKKGHAGAFFSLEMQVDRLVGKCIQAETGLTSYDYERQLNSDEWFSIDECYRKYHQLPIFIDDTPLASFTHIKAKSKLLKERYDIRFIVIDYIQLMGGERTNNSTREEFISTISRNLKALSKELQVTIIALSQLNRGVESRTDKKPLLSDLRESGAIEQDADIVIFPFRPEYYWPDDVSLKGEGMFLVAKNRNGSTGEASMKYNKSVTRFEDLSNEISYGRPTAF